MNLNFEMILKDKVYIINGPNLNKLGQESLTNMGL